MKIVLQRVSEAKVVVEGETTGEIGRGYVLLTGFAPDDHEELFQPLIDKLARLQLFSDDTGRFAYSIEDIQGELLVISQFTLFADIKKGRKPSVHRACPPERAEKLYERFVGQLRTHGFQVATGIFGADMKVSLTNEGPVTLELDTEKLFPRLHN
jgi:D-tyrosyl-tRNA(Tyr) deacylase